ncbi:hypothetical protein G6F56_006304 [Rhizopus delemar]|nr:hypothetical protein G6F56_006304 [Rhizopus delemar]
MKSSTQVNKTLTSERDKVSVALIKASSAEITKKLQVPVVEEEEGKNQNTAYMSNNSEQTLREEDSDDGEPNSVNENDGYSNERSDNASDKNLVYIPHINEDHFISIISSDEEVPTYLKQFELFQLKAFNKAKTVGLFVNADLYQILCWNFTSAMQILTKKTFDAIAGAFRGIGDVPDRDELKIKLFKIYEEAEKEDRKTINVLINLCVVYAQLNELPNEETIDYNVEEQELINNFADPILSPLLQRPEKEKLFLWLDRMVTKTYNTRPDAGCAIIHERRIERFFVLPRS